MKTLINTLDINITGICNYACEYCYGENDNIDMSVKILKKIIILGKMLGVDSLEFCGGEPLLHKKFVEFIKEAKKANFKLILRTNGIFIKKYEQIIIDNFDWVGISLDGLEKENHFMRKCSTLSSKEKFDLPINNIIELKSKNPSLKIILNSVASSLNYRELEKFSKYILKNRLPIHKWKIYQFLANNYRSIDFRQKYYLSNEKFAKLKIILDTKKLQSNLGVEVIFKEAHENNLGCIIIKPKGDIFIGGKKIININKNNLNFIMNKILKIPELNIVMNNKLITYSK